MSKNTIRIRVPAETPTPPLATWFGRMVGTGYNRVSARLQGRRGAARVTPAARLRSRAARIAAREPGVAADLRAVADRSEWTGPNE